MADQAPPTSCRKLRLTGKRNRSKMDGEGAASMAFHMVLRSHVKKKLRSNASLPEEIIFNILLLLPAEILYTVMRYVCRRWHMIIHDPTFVSAHLLQSTRSTYLVMIIPVGSKPIFQLMHVRERNVEFSDYKFGFADRILSSCNGLMLAYDERCLSTGDALYYIFNPVTNKMLTLPPVTNKMLTLPRLTFGWKCGHLTLAPSSNLYKVVVVVVVRDKNGHSRCVLDIARATHLAIFTVGVDKEWRYISVSHLDDEVVKNLVHDPIANTGFLYWASRHSRASILTLNVESEIIKAIPVPKFGHYLEFAPMTNSVSCFYIPGDLSMVVVWMLKDYESGEWVKLPDFRLEGLREKVGKFEDLEYWRKWPVDPCCCLLKPECWSGNDERIIFRGRFNRHFYVFDIKTGNTILTPRSRDPFGINVRPITSTLAWVYDS